MKDLDYFVRVTVIGMVFLIVIAATLISIVSSEEVCGEGIIRPVQTQGGASVVSALQNPIGVAVYDASVAR